VDPLTITLLRWTHSPSPCSDGSTHHPLVQMDPLTIPLFRWIHSPSPCSDGSTHHPLVRRPSIHGSGGWGGIMSSSCISPTSGRERHPPSSRPRVRLSTPQYFITFRLFCRWTPDRAAAHTVAQPTRPRRKVKMKSDDGPVHGILRTYVRAHTD
jgi:hypothetical protein